MALTLRRTKFGLPLLYALIALIAWTSAAMERQPLSPRALANLMERPQEYLTLQGQIVDDPIWEEGDRPAWRMTVAAEAVDRVGTLQKASGRVEIAWRGAPEEVRPLYGDTWTFEGLVRNYEDRSWDRSFLSTYRLSVFGDGPRRLSQGDGFFLKRWSYAGRHAAAERLGLGLDRAPLYAGIIRALLLGYRNELPDTYQTLFSNSGTLHVFAISGLHVAVIAGLLVLVVQAMGVPMPRWIWVVGPLLIVYTVATGMRPSALRACIMALSVGSALIFARKPDVPSALALAALLILAAQPAQLAAPGFIFSFVVVAGLIRCVPWFSTPFQKAVEPEPFAPTAKHLTARLHRVGLWGMGLLATSVAAWIASAPLTATYFNLFSPVALLGNLFVIPGAFLVVLTGCLSLLTGMVSDFGAELFNHANRVFLMALIGIIERLSEIPGSHAYVRAPGWPWMIWWYAVLFGGLALNTRRQRRTAGWLALAVGVGLAYGSWRDQVDTLHAHVLEAGAGHAVLIRPPSAEPMILFDAGPQYRAESTIHALRQQGVNELGVLILSSALGSHVGGAKMILETIPVREIWRTDYPSRSAVYDEVLKTAERRSIPVRVMRAGDQGAWGPAHWEVLHPTEPMQYRRAGDASMVLRVAHGTKNILLTGGAGEKAEADMLAAHRSSAASIVVIGNQGRDNVMSEAWLAATQPEAIVLAVGSSHRREYPELSVLRRIAQRSDIQFLRTDESGPVDVRLTSRIRHGRLESGFKIVP